MSTDKSQTLLSCAKCGAKVQPDDRFCGNCGAALEQSPKAQPQEAASTTESPAEGYGFQKKGSWIFGTQVYVPSTAPGGERASGEVRKGMRKFWRGSEKTNTQMVEPLEKVYGTSKDVQVVEKDGIADTDRIRPLQISIETLNHHLSVLLTAIHAVERRLFWYTIAILLFIVILAALTGYAVFHYKP